jgi:hypothetical protein
MCVLGIKIPPVEDCKLREVDEGGRYLWPNFSHSQKVSIVLLTQCSNFSHSQKVSIVLLTQCSNFSHSQKVSIWVRARTWFNFS